MSPHADLDDLDIDGALIAGLVRLVTLATRTGLRRQSAEGGLGG